MDTSKYYVWLQSYGKTSAATDAIVEVWVVDNTDGYGREKVQLHLDYLADKNASGFTCQYLACAVIVIRPSGVTYRFHYYDETGQGTTSSDSEQAYVALWPLIEKAVGQVTRTIQRCRDAKAGDSVRVVNATENLAYLRHGDTGKVTRKDTGHILVKWADPLQVRNCVEPMSWWARQAEVVVLNDL